MIMYFFKKTVYNSFDKGFYVKGWINLSIFLLERGKSDFNIYIENKKRTKTFFGKNKKLEH